jgi:hypothetical protein
LAHSWCAEMVAQTELAVEDRHLPFTSVNRGLTFRGPVSSTPSLVNGEATLAPALRLLLLHTACVRSGSPSLVSRSRLPFTGSEGGPRARRPHEERYGTPRAP